MSLRLLPVFFLFLLSACDAAPPHGGEHGYAGLAGRWTGVEGTYLAITPQTPHSYRIEIRDLDGSRFFTGEDREHGIGFTRDGSTHIIRRGNGGDTGMKWLAGKKDCVVVAAHEGYCRD